MNTNKETLFHNRISSKNSEKCKRIRARLRHILGGTLSLDAHWVRSHMANCPRCHRRFASIGRVHLALSLLKSQPHAIDLLTRANTQAIGVLKHSLRNAPKADELKRKFPEPKRWDRWSKHQSSAANVAACIGILLLMKVGIFSSMDKFQTRSREVFKQYYATHAGQDMADEIFTA